MTKAIRIVVSNFNDRPVFRLDEPRGPGFQDIYALELDEAAIVALRDLDQNETASDAIVAKAGDAVYRSLELHPAVRRTMQAALGVASQEHTLHLSISNTEAENLPWEAICCATEVGWRGPDTGVFLALEPRWQLARLVEEGSSERLLRRFDGTLRVVVILGAADRSNEIEWQGIAKGLEQFDCPVEVSVWVCSTPVRDRIASEMRGNAAVHLIPTTVAEFERALIESRPQILHVFSHGSSDYGGYLKIDNRLSALDATRDPLWLDASKLAGLADELWFVSLNTCRGGEAGGGAHSLAYQLAWKGVPAVVGMREAIEARYASHFSRGMFSSLADVLRDVLAEPGERLLDSERLLRQPRQALLDAAEVHHPGVAACWKPWTLPALIRRDQPLIIHVPHRPNSVFGFATERDLAELEMLRELRVSLHEFTEPEIVDGLDARIRELAIGRVDFGGS